MMLGSSPWGLYGPSTAKAYGHLGFANNLVWADPERAISVAILTTGKAMLGTHVPALLALLALVFLYFFRHPGHVVLHMIVLTLAADIFLQVLSMVSPGLPFSSPRTVGARVASVSAAMIAGPIFILGFMALFTYFLYPSALLYTAGVAALLGLDLLLRSLLRRRVTAVGDRLEFTL